MDDSIFIRDFETPITPAALRPLDPRCLRVQFCRPLSEADHGSLATFLAQYPHVKLRAYGPYFKNFDLGFLRHYPSLRHLEIDVFDLNTLEGLEHLSPEVETFGFGQTKKRTHSLSILQRFPGLRTLHLDGHTKGIEVIGSFSRLDNLTLRSITLPDLSLLRPLTDLRALEIKLGGTKNLDLLPEIGKLRYLELWLIRGLTDLEPIASVPTLQFLFLQALKGVRTIPSLARLPLLRRIHIETMKEVTDLRPVADAPALEDLVAIDMPHLPVEAFQPFLGHPALRRASLGIGGIKKNDAATKLLGLPSANGAFTFEEDRSSSKVDASTER